MNGQVRFVHDRNFPAVMTPHSYQERAIEYMQQKLVDWKRWDAVELLASWWDIVEIELAADLDR